MTQRDLFSKPGGDNEKPIPDEATKLADWKNLDPKAISEGIAKLNALTKERARKIDRLLARSGTQGKCLTCKECFRWNSRRMPLHRAHCPQCGDKLVATTHLNRWPWNEGIEPLTAIQAWGKFKRA